MNRIMRWTTSEIVGLATVGVSEIWTEVGADGVVLREIGLDAEGHVVYCAPSEERHRGFFDETPVVGAANEVGPDRQLFERTWHSREVGGDAVRRRGCFVPVNH